MKLLFIVKFAVEMLAGLALVAVPSMTASLLIGRPFTEPTGLVLGRIAGIALLALGIACWGARNESQSRTTIGLIWALLFYDLSVVLTLVSAHAGIAVLGIGLWPAVVLHSGLGVWSVLCLRKVKQRVLM